MSQRESVVLMDFFEILGGFTKLFDHDFTGQGRTRPFTRPKWNHVLENLADLSPPEILVKKFRENKNQEIEFQNWKKIDQNVDIYIWTNNMFYRGHSWLCFEISRSKIGSDMKKCQLNSKWCPADFLYRKRRRNISKYLIFFL